MISKPIFDITSLFKPFSYIYNKYIISEHILTKTFLNELELIFSTLLNSFTLSNTNNSIYY